MPATKKREKPASVLDQHPNLARALTAISRNEAAVVPPSILDADPPDHMSDVAKKLWPGLLRDLVEAGIIKMIDLVGFEMLCEAYADWCNAKSALDEHMMVVRSSAGGRKATFQTRYFEVIDQNGNRVPRAHPAIAVMQDADRRLLSWLREYGMTPATRARWANPWTPCEPGVGVPSEVDAEAELAALDRDERDALRSILERRMRGPDRKEAA